MNRKIEILAPAGSFEGMAAAIKGGCDAVYIGGQQFGARAYADNLNQEQMLRAIEYAHLHDKKIYLTVNTLIKNNEIEQLYEYILPFYMHGLDAVIVQDLGVMSYLHKAFPNLDLHASTQMTLTMAQGANLLKPKGVTRIVTARELSFDEIREMRENTDLEIESFVHGALCYSFSGQCLMSSIIGGRSGNRGRCAQPCRMEYSMEKVGGKQVKDGKGYLLSPKDMCTILEIPQLVECGIDSFKIEGRMKKPEYAALTSALYRKYVDLYLESGKEGYVKYLEKNKLMQKQDIGKLMDLYNRGSFSSGYYVNYNGKQQMSMKRPNHNGVLVGQVARVLKNRAEINLSEDINAQDILEIRNQRGEAVYEFTVKNDVEQKKMYQTNFTHGLKINQKDQVYRTRNQKLLEEIQKQIMNKDCKNMAMGYLKARAGEKIMLALEYQNVRVEVYGEQLEAALSQPIITEKVRKQLYKNTETEFALGELIIESSEDWFMPIGKLNELRREAFSQLQNRVLQLQNRERVSGLLPLKAAKTTTMGRALGGICVSVMSFEQLQTACTMDNVTGIYVLFSLAEQSGVFDYIRQNKGTKEIFIILPTIFRRKTYHKYGQAGSWIQDYLKSPDICGFVVKNLEEIEFLQRNGLYVEKKPIILDYNMYVMNEETKKYWKEYEIERFTASCELNYNELKQLNIEGFDLIVYGYTPIMTSQQCVVNNTIGCNNNSDFFDFRDGIHHSFFGKNFCSVCYNVIYNGKPLHLLEHLEEVKELGVKNIRLDFTRESSDEMKKIIEAYSRGFAGEKEQKIVLDDFTKGHWKRGIE
ncbi:U32 family peptidase [Anaeromicropila populeti]|uniref:Putative protease n=1 Tax=Anaeromicropila populeti TaxID=37658 RepID=A0A1I6K7P9_9FIRM|nr:U32 family peptidase [Anaeromicropila populeti]SFR86900.1 putative protease [Anaeromicropila populeti]